MNREAQGGFSSRSTGSRRVTAIKAVAVLYTVLVLIQAIIAGRGWFKDFSLISTHGRIGEWVFLVAVVQLGLAFWIFGARSPLTIGFTVVLLLTGAQLGLGFASSDSSTAASLHIPNGVLIFGLSTVLASHVVRAGDVR